MKLVILSDLHILGPDDAVGKGLLRVLQTELQAGDTLVLAGDIFDAFMGGKDFFCQKFATLISAIRGTADRGVTVHMIEGNHDIQLKGVFPGLQVHGESVELQLGGKRFYVAHGDRVDQSDTQYKMLRWFFRSRVMQALTWALPGPSLEFVAEGLSRYSRGEAPLLPEQWSAEDLQEMRDRFHGFASEKVGQGFDYVVLGHCHDLDEAWLSSGSHSGQYINMGFPRVHRRFLVWTEDMGKIERHEFSFDSSTG